MHSIAYCLLQSGPTWVEVQLGQLQSKGLAVVPAEAEDDYWLHVALHDHLHQLEAAGDTFYASLPAPTVCWGTFILEQEHWLLKIIFSEIALREESVHESEKKMKICYDWLLKEAIYANTAINLYTCWRSDG